MSGCVAEKMLLLNKYILIFLATPLFSTRLLHVFSGSVPDRAFWRLISENILRLGVWDGNYVLVVWSYNFLCISFLSEFAWARALVVRVWGEWEGGGRWGAKWRIGNGKGWRESGFGASNSRVITLHEVLVDLVVSLWSGDKSLRDERCWEQGVPKKVASECS